MREVIYRSHRANARPDVAQRRSRSPDGCHKVNSGRCHDDRTQREDGDVNDEECQYVERNVLGNRLAVVAHRNDG